METIKNHEAEERLIGKLLKVMQHDDQFDEADMRRLIEMRKAIHAPALPDVAPASPGSIEARLLKRRLPAHGGTDPDGGVWNLSELDSAMHREAAEALGNLAMMVRRLARAASTHNRELADKAMDLLRRLGMPGIIARVTPTSDADMPSPAYMGRTTPDLHAQVMNLPCAPSHALSDGENEAYRAGHRDARHAAAELVSASTTNAGRVTSSYGHGVTA